MPHAKSVSRLPNPCIGKTPENSIQQEMISCPVKPSSSERPDGRYVCKHRGRCFYGRTQSEALAEREAYKRAAEDGIKDAPLTVGQYAARWLPVHKAGIGQKTYNDYAKQMDVLRDCIGDKRLRDVTPTDIKAVCVHYLRYSQSTIRRARILFSGLFDGAMADGYIPQPV